MSDLVDDWTVDDTETAGEILTLLGIGCDASKEPGADWRRDKIAKLIRARISQQDAELERLRREVEEAKEFRAILEGHLAAAIDDYNDALKALEPFARVAEHDIGESEAGSDFFMPMKTYNRAPLLTVGDFRNALALRAKAEETDRG